MKVLINKTHEIEVDEKFRDMFPMKGCKGVRCNNKCSFYVDGFPGCKLNIEAALKNTVITKCDFTAEIVEDKVKFEDLKIGQKVWHLKEEAEIYAKIEDPNGQYIALGEYECKLPLNNISLTPPPQKKKVTKTVEAWAFVDLKTNKVEYLSNYENGYTNNFVKVKLSGNYTVEE